VSTDPLKQAHTQNAAYQIHVSFQGFTSLVFSFTDSYSNPNNHVSFPRCWISSNYFVICFVWVWHLTL